MRWSLLIISLSTASLFAQAAELHWKPLPTMPDPEGFAASYAGVSGGWLLVAGGANFPGKKPWDGGKKAWYDTVFALDRPDGNWVAAGKLPRPLAYGVSVTHRGRVVCVGGSDANRHYPDTFGMELNSGKILVTTLPSLPISVANACGALVGDTLYIAGGLETPDSKETLKRVFTLDLAAKTLEWREATPWPGPGRMLAVAAEFDGAFWLMGGANLVAGADGKTQRKYLKDAYRFDPATGWTRLADLPHPLAAAPSPAPASPAGPILLGGDDGTGAAIAPQNRGPFPSQILMYDKNKATWNVAGEMPSPAVTVPLAPWNGSWALPGGEIRPGVRTPKVWRLNVVGNKEGT